MVDHLAELVGLTKGELYDLPADSYVPRAYLFLDRHEDDGKRTATMELFFNLRLSWEAILTRCRVMLAERGERVVGAVLSFHSPIKPETIELHAMTVGGSTHRRAVGVFRDSRNHLCPADTLVASTDDGDHGHPEMHYMEEAFDSLKQTA